MPDLDLIKKAETDPVYWRVSCLSWWRQYLRLALVVRRLRIDNRQLRSVLTDVLSEP